LSDREAQIVPHLYVKQMELHNTNPNHWSNRIPPETQLYIGNKIRDQLFKLPVNLFLEWQQHDSWLRYGWFQEASKYIDTPFVELYFS
jgi:hypothetical protein